MPIDIKTGASNWGRTKQPHVKLSPTNWTPLKRALVKTASGWQEVWPSEIVYVHTGVGYNLNVASCFGNPNASANYIFINNGYIGSNSSNTWALETGVFPIGSSVVIINNGMIHGKGGQGASFASSGAGSAISQAQPGGPSLNLQTPVVIQNNGTIAGGGGGGGASGDFAGKSRYNFRGGGGGGITPGVGGVYTWGGGSPSAATYENGGRASDGGGHGGNIGVDGLHATRVVNDDYSMMTVGAPAGIAIGSTGFIMAGSTGINATGVRGRQVPGTTSSRIRCSGIGGRGQWGQALSVDITYDGPAGTLTGTWISGGGSISVGRSGNTWTFRSTQSTSPWTRQTWRSGTMRFTLTGNGFSDYFDMAIRVGDASMPYDDGGGGCCFTGDSLVTMADGTQKRIDTIVPGDAVKTPFGSSEVDWIRLPLLADRPLLMMDTGGCKTSGEHCIWSKDPETGAEYWATRDMERWELEARHRLGPGLNGIEPFDLVAQGRSSAIYATETGWRDTTWTVVENAPDNTQLYHLYLKDHASYFVDGFLVIGELPRDETLIDWTAFTWEVMTPRKPVYMVYDYPLDEVDRSPFKRITKEE